MKPAALIFLITRLLFSISHEYKVLVFSPAYGASHSNFLGKLPDISIDAGHNVTLLIPIFQQEKEHLVGSKKSPKHYPDSTRFANHKTTPKFWLSRCDREADMENGFGFDCNERDIFQQTNSLESLEDEHFDLAVSESFFICAFALFDRLKIKSTIIADSLLFTPQVRSALGKPTSASYFPDFSAPLNDQMDFLKRSKNVFAMLFATWFTSSKSHVELESMKELYELKKTPQELLASAAYYFVNSNRYLDFPSPTLPKTVLIGGMQINVPSDKIKELPEEWNDVLNLRKTTVLVSFGSMAQSCEMAGEFKAAFLQVFESMPETTFIWKYEKQNDTIASHFPNVSSSLMIPNSAFLSADDRLSLFITHGGLGSTMEVAYQGKPSIVIPLMADQPRNAKMLVRHGGSVLLDKTRLDNPQEIERAIREILENRSYRRNAKKLSSILNEQPYSPKEVVLKHYDFAVKHGELESLNSEGRKQNVLVFYSVDIVVEFVLLIFAIRLVGFIILNHIIQVILKPALKSKIE